MTKKPLRPVDVSEIEKEFVVHLRHLNKSLAEFDAGDTEEYRRIAVELRVLLHKTRNSNPVAEQVKLPLYPFVSYAEPLNERNMLTECSITMMVMSNDGVSYAPVLDKGPAIPHDLTLDQWKAEPILRDDQREVMSRWDLVITVADQQGAHVDSALEDRYYRLRFENSYGWYAGDDINQVPFAGVEKACIRHIGWEAFYSLNNQWARMVGNRGCQCGSGRKARYCCMK